MWLVPQCREEIWTHWGYGQGQETQHRHYQQIPKPDCLGVNLGSASLGYLGERLSLCGPQFSHLKMGADNRTHSPELVEGLRAISI